jgi:hypothetical protein
MLFHNKKWVNEYDEFHKENGPAIEYSNGDKFWYIHNKLHRIDGPAVQFGTGYEEYWINGIQINSHEEFIRIVKLKFFL